MPPCEHSDLNIIIHPETSVRLHPYSTGNTVPRLYLRSRCGMSRGFSRDNKSEFKKKT